MRAAVAGSLVLVFFLPQCNDGFKFQTVLTACVRVCKCAQSFIPERVEGVEHELYMSE